MTNGNKRTTRRSQRIVNADAVSRVKRYRRAFPRWTWPAPTSPLHAWRWAGDWLRRQIASAGRRSPGALFSPKFTFEQLAIDALESRQMLSGIPEILADLNLDTVSANIFSSTSIDGTLYFNANDGLNGTELWKSDGTPAGTVLVADIFAGSNGSNPHELVNVNGTLCFVANDGVNGFELWKSDGTAAGTVMLKDIAAVSYFSGPKYLTNVNGTLFFMAVDGVSDFELWKSDGTAAGTALVKDIRAGIGNSYARELTNVNGTLFFQANDGGAGDGTQPRSVAGPHEHCPLYAHLPARGRREVRGALLHQQ